MKIAILLDGVVNKILTTPFLRASLNEDSTYTLEGEALKIEGVTTEQILIIYDHTDLNEADIVDDDLRLASIPIESFITVTPQRAAADALGLLMRDAVAAGNITDEELLRVAPALETRTWQAGLRVEVGDVYAFGVFLWRCLQSHVAQCGWEPPKVSALWRKVEKTGAVRIWDTDIDYVVNDAVFYPDAEGNQYICQQGHTSQAGWEPSNVPALWQLKGEDDNA